MTTLKQQLHEKTKYIGENTAREVALAQVRTLQVSTAKQIPIKLMEPITAYLLF